MRGGEGTITAKLSYVRAYVRGLYSVYEANIRIFIYGTLFIVYKVFAPKKKEKASWIVLYLQYDTCILVLFNLEAMSNSVCFSVVRFDSPVPLNKVREGDTLATFDTSHTTGCDNHVPSLLGLGTWIGLRSLTGWVRCHANTWDNNGQWVAFCIVAGLHEYPILPSLWWKVFLTVSTSRPWSAIASALCK